MGFPIPFLAGLAVLLLYEQFGDSLPGEESLGRLILCLSVTVLPWLTAQGTARWLRGVVARGAVPQRGMRLALLLQPLVVPLCYAGVVFGGSLPEFAWQLFPDAQLPRLAVLAAPLVAMEVSMRLAERRTVRWLEIAGFHAPAQLGTSRLAMTFFVLTPILALAGAADVLAIDRRLEMFFFETSAGAAIGFLLLVAALCVLLPLAFRWLLPVSTELPVHLASDLRRTAERLGFRARAMLSMRTGHRIVNAALVGPAPWPRFLVLTDGLLALLDPQSLRGVVAHEVGHARANHPALLLLLFACLPLFLFYPAQCVGLLELEGIRLALLLIAVIAVIAVTLRGLAHRFEYEADQLSAEALGGASFCVRALRRVGELSPRSLHRSSLRHPSEERRIHHLYACEQDPAVRERFWRRGRAVRRTLYATLLVSFGLCVWALWSLWPIDRAALLLYCGRFAEARAELDALNGDVPASQAAMVEELRRIASAGVELGLPPAEWQQMREPMAERATARAVAAINGGGVEQAMPWLALALEQRRPAAWLRSLYLYGRAVADSDAERGERIRRHLLAIDTPAQVKAAL